jgi:hypothetical protein
MAETRKNWEKDKSIRLTRLKKMDIFKRIDNGEGHGEIARSLGYHVLL